MTNVIVVSDNHNIYTPIEIILNKYNNINYYIHCGDSEFDQEKLMEFICVRGNNDFYYYDEYKILKIEDIRVLIVHGHHYIYGHNRDLLIAYSKKLKVQLVLFGHSHIYEDFTIDNIRFLNPGSLRYNRNDGSKTYILLNINKSNIKVEKKYIDY